MTDRLNGLVVTLEGDIREDDAAGIVQAIGLIKGVAHVEPHVATPEDYFARSQAAHEFKMKLMEFIGGLT